jgi:hypothetical protein
MKPTGAEKQRQKTKGEKGKALKKPNRKRGKAIKN